jgi:hypothetical protein
MSIVSNRKQIYVACLPAREFKRSNRDREIEDCQSSIGKG